jgi:ribonuclease HII
MPSFQIEKTHQGLVVGLDEVGIGCWAGAVFAGAAYVPFTTDSDFLTLLNDSKKLSAKKRKQIFELYQSVGIKWSVASASLEEITTLNIRGAALKAMERAYHTLGITAQMALIDGTMIPQLPCSTQAVTKGDQRSYSIAAASIATKVVRDSYMQELHRDYPVYGWDRNAGYGTKSHQEALQQWGISPYHRRTYTPIKTLIAGKTENY